MAGISNLNTHTGKEIQGADNKSALYSLMILFFMMGFITCLNDILVPYLKKGFSLNYTEAALIQFCFFGAYAVMSIPSSRIVSRFGYQKGMVFGFVTAAVGCSMFLLAASMHSYPVFLSALFILASGIVLLQVAGNPYVSVLGSPETASARLTLTQALNSVGTTLAPLFGSYFILSGLQEGGSEAVKGPYLGIALLLLLIAVYIGKITLPDLRNAGLGSQDKKVAPKSSIWAHRHLVFGAIGIFTYVGAEVAIGSYLVNYFGMEHVAGLKEEDAAHYVAYYWGGAMVGRFIGSVLLNRISPPKVLFFNAVMSILMVLVSIFSGGSVAMWSIISVGLFNSIMFPTIFTLAAKGLGDQTATASGILSTAIVGGAIIPQVQGILADIPSITLQYAFLLPVTCYAYIAWFALKGHSVDE